MEHERICARCAVVYIRYVTDTLCPNCSLPCADESPGVEAEPTFLAETLALMRTHKRRFGYYTPENMQVSSLADEVRLLCFSIFDHCEKSGAVRDIFSIDHAFDQFKFQRRFYMQPHSRAILHRLFALYKKRVPRRSLFALLQVRHGNQVGPGMRRTRKCGIF